MKVCTSIDGILMTSPMGTGGLAYIEMCTTMRCSLVLRYPDSTLALADFPHVSLLEIHFTRYAGPCKHI